MESSSYDKKNILIFGMILVIIILFVINYKKSVEISSLQNSEKEKMTNQGQIQCRTPIDNNQKNLIPVPKQLPPLPVAKDSIILYYTDWCGHSQRMQPEWDAFAKEYAGRLHIEKIDCEKNRDRCGKVSGFPTIRLYKGGDDAKVIEFSGQRTKDGLKRFIDANK